MTVGSSFPPFYNFSCGRCSTPAGKMADSRKQTHIKVQAILVAYAARVFINFITLKILILPT